MDLFDSDIINGIFRLIHDETEYSVKGLIDTIQELEEDVRSHADTFFGSAYQIYQDYCREIEALSEEIGGELSDGDLVKLGILPERKGKADSQVS